MTKQQEVIDKAFGNIPKELPGKDIWDWIPTKRGFKLFYLKFWRKLFR